MGSCSCPLTTSPSGTAFSTPLLRWRVACAPPPRRIAVVLSETAPWGWLNHFATTPLLPPWLAQVECALPLPCPAAELCVVPTRDGTSIAAVLAVRAVPSADDPSGSKGSVVLLDFPQHASPEGLPGAATLVTPEVFCPSSLGEAPVVVSARLVAGCGDALCSLWDALDEGASARKLRGGDPWLLQPAERPLLSIGRERLLATVHADGTIQLWCAHVAARRRQLLACD